MSDSEINKIVENLKKSEKALNDLSKNYEKKISQLENQLKITEESVEKGEERAKLAEVQARQADEKYQKAIELKDGEYKQLILDLFEVPKEKLITHIKEQSSASNNLTKLTAIISIFFSLLISYGISYYFQSKSEVFSKKLENSTNNLEISTQNLENLTNNLVGRIETIEDKTDYLLSNPEIKKLAELIKTEKENFSNYSTDNDLVLVYKMRIGRNSENFKYKDLIEAFRIVGINKDLIPDDENVIESWDKEYVALCKNAIEIINTKKYKKTPLNLPLLLNTNSNFSDMKKMNSNSNSNMDSKNSQVEYQWITLIEEDRYYKRYKTENDRTDYDGWGYRVQSMTYQDLQGYFEKDLEIFEKRINFNKK